MCSYLCAGSGFYINKTCCANYRVDRLLCTSSFTNPSNHVDHKLFSYSAFIRFFQHTDAVPTRKLITTPSHAKPGALLAFIWVQWCGAFMISSNLVRMLNQPLNKQLSCRWYIAPWKLIFHTYSLECVSAHLEVDCNVFLQGQINSLSPSATMCRHGSESNRLK